MKNTILILITLLCISNIKAQVTTVNVMLAEASCTSLNVPIEKQIEFNFYPNPSSGVIYIEENFIKETLNPTIKIYDIRGALVYKHHFENKDYYKKRLVINNLQSGIYVLSYQSNTKKGSGLNLLILYVST